jgi:uncharacterized membrane protein HdeD (DUF308 family)
MNSTVLVASPLRRVICHEFKAIRGRSIWLASVGITLIVLGTIMLAFSVLADLTTVSVLGALIVIGGVTEAIAALWCRQWSGFFLALLSGALGVGFGLMLLENSGQTGLALSIVLASFVFVSGIFRTVASVAHRFDGWEWLLLCGVIDIVIGVMVWRQLPIPGLTVTWLLFGISTVSRGVAWLMVGFTLKRIPNSAA